jgi:hypothetical protein
MLLVLFHQLYIIMKKNYLNQIISFILSIITMYLTFIDDVTIQGYFMLPQVSQLLNLNYNIPLESMVFKLITLYTLTNAHVHFNNMHKA